MRRNPGHLLTAALLGAATASAVPVAAQSGGPVSRAVVQPLPPQGVSDLNEALQRLARNSADLGALIQAGNASLELNDIDAAIGFFGRAQELSPDDPRVKLGLAGAYVRSERPIDALRLFDEAERAGASTTAFASDRGLAYDLVGDNSAAQAQYERALAAGQDDETVRRLALSQAMAGDREAFEKTLFPQLEAEDFAGFRARAFGLAILGDEDEAVAIADSVMPRELAARISPYLRYMRRLTRAQQAAAVNLGRFPRAAQIGRDDPRIAQYAGTAIAARGADARLAPGGVPLGATAPLASEAQRRRPDRAHSAVDVSAGEGEQTPASPSGSPNRLPAVAPSTSPPVAREIPPSVTQPERPATAGTASVPPATATPPQPARIVLADPVPRPGFDLGQGAAGTSAAPAADTPQPAQAAPDPLPASVADAFAGFTLSPGSPTVAAAGAVDITAIEPPREVERKPPAAPAPPAHPQRIWVQVATGKDLAAFKWDWRRISRRAPEILADFKPMTTRWGEANRLLAGPFETEKAARDAVGKLREADLDSFTFTSDEGQEIAPLD